MDDDIRHSDDGPHARDRARVRAALAGAGLALFAGYALAGSWLAGQGDVLAHSSGIYDMDVARVTADWTGDAPPLRASVHPLQKLFVAPLGGALASALPGGAPAAARLVAAAASALGAASAGLLAWRLARGARGAALAACALTGVSFAHLLAGALPESAVLAGLASVVPLVFREVRRGRALGAGECVVWGALAVAGFGLTVTQLGAVAIAAAFRGAELARSGAQRPAGLAARALVTLAGAVAVALALGALQARLYPGAPALLAESPLPGERPFLRGAELRVTPLRHAARLAAHFLVVDFVAPFPARSPFLMRDYAIPTWSLSAEAAGLADWDAGRLALAGVWGAALAALAWAGRWRDPRLAAPAGVLGFHFALHLVYGREYVLYAPHWHAVAVALGVAAAWNGRLGRTRRGRRGLGVACAVLAAALLASNAGVLAAVGDEVAHGLGKEVRDARGRPLPASEVAP